eukprot:gene18517-biopygen6925
MSGGCVYRGDTSKSQEWLHHKFSSSPTERSWLCLGRPGAGLHPAKPGCRVAAAWLPLGCRSGVFGASWGWAAPGEARLPRGCRVAAAWLPLGCRLAAAQVCLGRPGAGLPPAKPGC